jgi:hypothetical protein
MTSSQPTAANEESKSAKTVRILIGGDYPPYLDGLAHLIRECAVFNLVGVVSNAAIVQAFSKSTVDPANRVEQRTRTLRKQRDDTRQHKKPPAPSWQAEKPLHSAPAEHLIEACPSPPPQLALGLPQLRW